MRYTSYWHYGNIATYYAIPISKHAIDSCLPTLETCSSVISTPSDSVQASSVFRTVDPGPGRMPGFNRKVHPPGQIGTWATAQPLLTGNNRQQKDKVRICSVYSRPTLGGRIGGLASGSNLPDLAHPPRAQQTEWENFARQ
jgi:hypothetical protein